MACMCAQRLRQQRAQKPRNLLVNTNCDLRVCDFGLARLEGTATDTLAMSDYIATRWYRSPEVRMRAHATRSPSQTAALQLLLRSGRYGKPVDMWAIGCIFGELLSRRPMFPGRDGVSSAHTTCVCLKGVRARAEIHQLHLIRQFVGQSVRAASGAPAVAHRMHSPGMQPSTRVTCSHASMTFRSTCW
jgi:serine/threonine protein kinase